MKHRPQDCYTTGLNASDPKWQAVIARIVRETQPPRRKLSGRMLVIVGAYGVR